jgi:hypothetical protein
MWNTENVLIVAGIAIAAMLAYGHFARPGRIAGGSANQGAKDLAIQRSLLGAKKVAEAGKAAIVGGATKASLDESAQVVKV